MINRRLTSVMLIGELALLALIVTTNVLNPGALSPLAEALVFMLALGNIGLFYSVIVQKHMTTEPIVLFIQFILVSMYSLGQLLTNSAGIVLGVVSLIACCTNIMLVALAKDDTHVRTRVTERIVEKSVIHADEHKTLAQHMDEEDTFEEDTDDSVESDSLFAPKAVVLSENQSETAQLLARESELAHMRETPTSFNPNIVNVNVDAAAPTSSIDREDIRDLKRNDERISDKIEHININVDQKIDGVQKELEELKKKEKTLYVASTGGKKVHNPNCMVAQRIPKEKRLIIEDMEEAIKDGYTPCSVCVPIQTITVDSEGQ